MFPHPYTLNDAKRFISLTKQKNDHVLFFAVEIERKAVGSVGITLKQDIYRKNAEIAYFPGEAYWGKGIMTDIIKELVKFIFTTYDVIRVYAEPFANNTGSRKALEKSGFKCEATF